MDTLFFLGRLHVLALHLPIGIILAVVVLESFARTEKYRQLASAGAYLWGLAAITSIATVALGYMHFAEGGFDGPSGYAHRLFGTSVAVVTSLLWWLRVKAPSAYAKAQLPAAVLVVALVSITGHYGGNLTHGSTYLVEYAPQPIRTLMGLGARRPPVTDLASADPYLDVVRPILEGRCSTCHGQDKTSGEFDMSTYDSTLAGGETGMAVVPGNASISELYRRITLPEDHDAFMPAEGRTPLTDDQVSILQWWIDAGAPRDRPLGDLDPPAATGAAISRELGLSDQVARQAERAADPAVLTALYEAGFLARQVSQADADLIVSVNSRGSRVSREQLDVLLRAAPSVVELDLDSAGLTDEDLAGLETLTSLARLSLSNNGLRDSGVARLRNLPALEKLNLHGNSGITDASIEAIAGMEMLASVYLWETGITETGIRRLQAMRPALDVETGKAAEFLSKAAEAVAGVED